jgi:hypothetical protein
VWLFGTDDQFIVPGSSTGSRAVDFSNNDSFTALVVMRQWNTNSTFRGVLSKFQNAGSLTGPGYIVLTGSPSTTLSFNLEDGKSFSPNRGNTFTNGVVSAFVGVLNKYVPTLQSTASTGILVRTTTPSITSLGSLVNTNALTIGSRGPTSGSTVDIEFVAAAIWRRPLSQEEILTLRTYYLDRWK